MTRFKKSLLVLGVSGCLLTCVCGVLSQERRTVYPPGSAAHGLLGDAQRLRREHNISNSPTWEEALRLGELLRRNRFNHQTADQELLQTHGIRTLEGTNLVLYTDLKPSPEVDILPQIFDLAVVEYCKHFHVEPRAVASWKVIGSLIGDTAKFRQAGLLRDAPPFSNGYSIGNRLWLKDQKSDYYRRHLLIHEGVHAFMNYVFGTCGPPWYMEAMAEYLGTHRWQDGKLTLGIMPQSAEETPLWGRINLIRDDTARGNRELPDSIFRFEPAVYETPRGYAWSWAAGYYLDQHPRYQERFRQINRQLTFPDFTQRLWESLEPDWTELNNGWMDFTRQLAYGYDFPQTLIDFTQGRSLTEPVTLIVRPERGWQNSGILVEEGKPYEITAEGRFQLADQPKIWDSEADGVTVRYHDGRPLGLLLAAAVSDKKMSSPGETPPGTAFDTPFRIGRHTVLTPSVTGTLYFRINDFPNELQDNRGELKVIVRAMP